MGLFGSRRRKMFRKNERAGIGYLILLFIILAIAWKVFSLIEGHEILVAVITSCIVVAFIVTRIVRARTNKALDRDKIATSIENAFQADRGEILARKKLQLSYENEYGQINERRWIRERDAFIYSFVKPHAGDLLDNPTYADIVTAAIEDRCSTLISTKQLKPSENTLRDGNEYAMFVADVLKGLNWTVSMTPPNDRQGADIIAKKDVDTAVIQCKFYTKAVGHKAVQEAAAARQHYGATRAAVVSKSGFTDSARQLGATTVVALLHHDELGKL